MSSGDLERRCVVFRVRVLASWAATGHQTRDIVGEAGPKGFVCSCSQVSPGRIVQLPPSQNIWIPILHCIDNPVDEIQFTFNIVAGDVLQLCSAIGSLRTLHHDITCVISAMSCGVGQRYVLVLETKEDGCNVIVLWVWQQLMAGWRWHQLARFRTDQKLPTASQTCFAALFGISAART